MKLLTNIGDESVARALEPVLADAARLDIASNDLSLFAFAALAPGLEALAAARLALAPSAAEARGLLGAEADRPLRNQLRAPALARRCAAWLEAGAQIRELQAPLPQAALLAGVDAAGAPPLAALAGQCPFTTDGLGLSPGDPLGLVYSAEEAAERVALQSWFDGLWNGLPATSPLRARLLQSLAGIAAPLAPAQFYHLVLHCLFKAAPDALDEETVVKSATGIRDSVVWKKLFRFQRDGVVGAIEKLERHGGCILADSVGLGKTFEALAVVKYYELRNDRVLVLTPKRLRDNWTLYKSNDRRNILAADRLHYDVLNHTDLGRQTGSSGDIELAHVNWGNYDLVVIDESHNFRNKAAHNLYETRYDLLMRRIIREGVKTRVLMLSATPVNNRLSDLKNQIAFVTEGQDSALRVEGIGSIDATVRQAQTQFNRWLTLEAGGRTPARLLDMLGFDYFKLLDTLTIARSRKHIERYYGLAETGRFPQRMKPLNVRPDVDSSGGFAAIADINNEIRRLNLAAYAPLRYVLPQKRAAYDAKYSVQVRGGGGTFRQVDREESLVHLMRINVLKRMESAVPSFALTVGRQLADVEVTLARIAAFRARTCTPIETLPGSPEGGGDSIGEPDIEEIETDDPVFENLLVGRKVKVLLTDLDLVRWKCDLEDDRDRLAALHAAAARVGAAHDAKLAELRRLIAAKVHAPLNAGNKKVIVFTAFADTARYLYQQLAPWALAELGLHSALVTGGGANQCNLPGLGHNFGGLLAAFAPRAKERPAELAAEGEIDLLIATDCISEGQNLQDCDTLINYDIHWNPVRIIQRFGRIDRIGSPNDKIQLINFWPNIELEEYINLEQRVGGRMVLLDISATGEENVIAQQAGNAMNDLEYRRAQLLRLQDRVIDLEDLSSGISIADLTLAEFRLDLAHTNKLCPGQLQALPPGCWAVMQATAPTGTSGEPTDDDKNALQPGVVFCLRAAGEAALRDIEPAYPLAPYYLLHVGENGAAPLGYSAARQVLGQLKTVCAPLGAVDETAAARQARATRGGTDMKAACKQLAAAVAAIAGTKEQRAVASLFGSGGTHALPGEFAGIGDYEVEAYLVVLPPLPAASAEPAGVDQ